MKSTIPSQGHSRGGLGVKLNVVKHGGPEIAPKRVT